MKSTSPAQKSDPHRRKSMFPHSQPTTPARGHKQAASPLPAPAAATPPVEASAQPIYKPASPAYHGLVWRDEKVMLYLSDTRVSGRNTLDRQTRGLSIPSIPRIDRSAQSTVSGFGASDVLSLALLLLL